MDTNKEKRFSIDDIKIYAELQSYINCNKDLESYNDVIHKSESIGPTTGDIHEWSKGIIINSNRRMLHNFINHLKTDHPKALNDLKDNEWESIINNYLNQ